MLIATPINKANALKEMLTGASDGYRNERTAPGKELAGAQLIINAADPFAHMLGI
jgi:hypothetical protein